MALTMPMAVMLPRLCERHGCRVFRLYGLGLMLCPVPSAFRLVPIVCVPIVCVPIVRVPSGFLPMTTLGFVNTNMAVPVAWLGFVLINLAMPVARLGFVAMAVSVTAATTAARTRGRPRWFQLLGRVRMGAMTMGAWAIAVSMAMAAVRRRGRINTFRMAMALGSTWAATMAMPVRAEHTEQHEVDEEAEQRHDGHQLAVHLHGVNHPVYRLDHQNARDHPDNEDRQQGAQDLHAMESVAVLRRGIKRGCPKREETNKVPRKIREQVRCICEQRQAVCHQTAGYFHDHS